MHQPCESEMLDIGYLLSWVYFSQSGYKTLIRVAHKLLYLAEESIAHSDLDKVKGTKTNHKKKNEITEASV